jgi:branched-subunit amino acid transport protein
MDSLNYYGIALGAVSFLIIGIFHPLVIKGEYYFGKNIWWAFLIAGIAASILSLVVKNFAVSTALGVFGFSSFWGIKEVFEQVERVKEGRFPKNPRRN